jgi:hypothetical protein
MKGCQMLKIETRVSDEIIAVDGWPAAKRLHPYPKFKKLPSKMDEMQTID